MKKITIILTLVSAVMMMISCDRKEELSGAEEGARIEFRLPGMYDKMSGGVSTKAVDVLDNPRKLNDSDPTGKDYAELISLPVGSTLWLTYSEKQSDGTFTIPELRAYKIVDDDGYHSMYACTYHEETGADGLTYQVIDSETTGQPLILEDGTYKFKMISPALPITYEENKGWRLPVDNGMYFYSTDGRYMQTKPKEVVVNTENLAADKVMYVKLNPIINQTARWNFKIFKGENVDSLMMLPAGIEVSGLQNPYDINNGEKTMFYWASDDIADTLKMKMGDKLQWVKIPADEMWTETATGLDGKYQEALCGHVGFLPTNSLSTTVVILFNMLVNGIPTQYETTLNQKIYEHAHSYNIGVEVDQKDGIRLFNWQNQAWTGDLELYPKN